MNNTLTLIKARKAEMAAVEARKTAERNAQQDREGAAFREFYDMWLEVQDMPADDMYRENGTVKSVTHLRFYDREDTAEPKAVVYGLTLRYSGGGASSFQCEERDGIMAYRTNAGPVPIARFREEFITALALLIK